MVCQNRNFLNLIPEKPGWTGIITFWGCIPELNRFLPLSVK
jgi:hypothetical protein